MEDENNNNTERTDTMKTDTMKTETDLTRAHRRGYSTSNLERIGRVVEQMIGHIYYPGTTNAVLPESAGEWLAKYGPYIEDMSHSQSVARGILLAVVSDRAMYDAEGWV